MHSHILICGDIGVGKSTLINRLIAVSGRPISGYRTKSLNKLPDGTHQIYIFGPDDIEHAVLVASCAPGKNDILPDVFDTVGVELLNRIRSDNLIVMDEIGFMEQSSPVFMARVLELLDGDIPVIAAVKSPKAKGDFLDRVRQHPNADLYEITEENRNTLFELLKSDWRLK